MSEHASIRREVGAFALMLMGLGSIIGSGWLFGAWRTAAWRDWRSRDDMPTANTETQHALDQFDHPQGLRDVRGGPYLWLIRAEALRRSGDVRQAHDWAQRALDASRKYDAPEAESIRDAEAALRQTAL